MLNLIKRILFRIWWILKFISKGVIIFVGAIISLILFIWLIVFLYNEYGDYQDNKFRNTKPFEAAIWQDIIPQNEEEYSARSYLRCNMYRDLMKNHLHFGMSYGEVVKLLGEPYWVTYFTNPETKKIDYVLGRCAPIDRVRLSESRPTIYDLQLFFDKDSKLVAFGHYVLNWRERNYREFEKKSFRNHEKTEKVLFYCDDEKDECVRRIKIFGGNQTTGTSYCYSDEECERRMHNASDYPDYSIYKVEIRKKSEVESEWGYKLW